MGTQLARFGETDAKPINPIYRRLDLGLSFAWWAFGTDQSNTRSHGKDVSVLGGSKLARTNKVIPPESSKRMEVFADLGFRQNFQISALKTAFGGIPSL